MHSCDASCIVFRAHHLFDVYCIVFWTHNLSLMLQSPVESLAVSLQKSIGFWSPPFFFSIAFLNSPRQITASSKEMFLWLIVDQLATVVICQNGSIDFGTMQINSFSIKFRCREDS